MLITLLYSLAGGMLATLATGRTDRISWPFLRLVSVIAFAATTGATAWAIARNGDTFTWSQPVETYLAAAAALAATFAIVIAPLAARAAGPFRGVCATGGLLALTAAATSATMTLPTASESVVLAIPRVEFETETATHTGTTAKPETPAETGAPAPPRQTLALATVAAGQILSGLLLGTITVSWLLGHAYLTATKMTIEPMRRFTRLFSLAVALRLAFMIVCLATAAVFGGDVEPSILAHLEHAWLIVVLRVGVGLIGVGVFAYMVADCVRLRSTQSATGILYFGSLFAYIGELASLQLIAECGWPL